MVYNLLTHASYFLFFILCYSNKTQAKKDDQELWRPRMVCLCSFDKKCLCCCCCDVVVRSTRYVIAHHLQEKTAQMQGLRQKEKQERLKRLVIEYPP